jgi:hypothetical protein
MSDDRHHLQDGHFSTFVIENNLGEDPSLMGWYLSNYPQLSQTPQWFFIRWISFL